MKMTIPPKESDVLTGQKQYAQQIEHPMVCAIVKAVVSLTQKFDIALIAEDVKTATQCQTLQELGCHSIQGFFFSHPQPLAHWLSPHAAQNF